MALEVTADRVVPATPEAIWPDLADPARFAEWYAFCDAVDVPEPGVRVLRGSWGPRRSAVTTRITEEVPNRRLAWRHESETLDDAAASSLAMETVVEVTLEPVDGGTEVVITSRQQAAGWWQGALIRLLGRRKVADIQRQSLALLAARHAGTPPG